MNIICRSNRIFLLVFVGVVVVSCTRKNVSPVERLQRLDNYINSDNIHIAAMFSEENMTECGVQPALTQKEFAILDALVEKIPAHVRMAFDQKYTAWLNCWTPLDSIPEKSDIRLSLKCSGTEFQDLVDFCRQQDGEVFLLLYQLAARAECPYDQLLLHPVYDLLESFPEFNNYWGEVSFALQREKPDLKDRACNESTIWCTRKILETKYGYTYASNFFDTRRMLLMTQNRP